MDVRYEVLKNQRKMNVMGGEVRGFKNSTGLKSKGPPKRALRTTKQI